MLNRIELSEVQRAITAVEACVGLMKPSWK